MRSDNGDRRPDVQNILQGKRVLIVDDDISLAGRIKRILQNHGGPDCNIELAHCIDTASDHLKREVSFDLMILDMKMPKTKEDLEAVEEEGKELEGVRAILRMEDEIDEKDCAAVEEVAVAYEKRALMLSRIHSLQLNEAGITILKDCPSLPTLILTAFTNSEIKNRGLDLLTHHGRPGDWVNKPVSEGSLIKKCVKLLAKQNKCAE
ncbi:hypothetical protein KAT92_02425 [Candidatus Babeliales bacterium]|nr:hypothetical protein [Candidatus Babeliales bacterium]